MSNSQVNQLTYHNTENIGIKSSTGYKSLNLKLGIFLQIKYQG